MSKIKILVVDDDTDLAEGISDVLEAKGCHSSIANDGSKAINLVKEDNFDIVLMDMRMPDMNGVETYRKIKMIKPEMKVLMMTAYSAEDVVNEAIKEGVCGVMSKPVDLEKLITSIEMIVGRASINDETDPAVCKYIS